MCVEKFPFFPQSLVNFFWGGGLGFLSFDNLNLEKLQILLTISFHCVDFTSSRKNKVLGFFFILKFLFVMPAALANCLFFYPTFRDLV